MGYMKEQLCPTCVERGDGKCSFVEALDQIVKTIDTDRRRRVTLKAKINAGIIIPTYLNEALKRDCPRAKALEIILKKDQRQKPKTSSK